MTAISFDDETVLEFWSDLDRTCESMAKISPRDAERFRSFIQKVDREMDLVVTGMYSVPPTAGVQTMMLDQTPEGQEFLRLQAISAWDLISENIEHPKIRLALARYAAAANLDPFNNGTGFTFYVVLPYMFRYGAAVCIGGSGVLADSLRRCFEDHGGTVRLNSEVREILIEDGKATGLVLQDGSTLRGTRAVVSGLNVRQVFPDMVKGVELPEGFQRRVDTLKSSDFSAMTVRIALNEPLRFRAGAGAVDEFFWVERCHSSVEEFRQDMLDLRNGNPVVKFASWAQQFRADPSRVPPGKGQVYILTFMPLDLKDGGREKWDEIGARVADEVIGQLREDTLNLTDENIVAVDFMTPLDITRYNAALVHGDLLHLAVVNWQMGANRPVPGWGQYRMPIPNFYMTAGSTHPGGSVTGGPGRNAAQVIMEDLGLDFDAVCQ